MSGIHLKLTVIGATLLLVLAYSIPSTRSAAVASTNTPLRLDTTMPVSEISAPAGGWSFRNHVIPVMTRLGCNSGACHGSSAGKGGFKLTLRGYDPEADYNTLTRQSLGRRTNKLEPARSLLLLKPTMTIGHGGGKRLEVGSLEYKVVSEWIAAGMAAPGEADPAITRLEVSPKEATIESGAEAQVRVKAIYSDGQAEDVTRWAKYAAADGAVATVDDDGKVKILGSGETAVTVWYQSRVAFARLGSPFPVNIAPEIFTKSKRSNFIDDLVLKKLQTLRISPSEEATDQEFVRRAYLDACGILPTAQEVESFLADTSADKRARLIDALLEREEFVDYWTNRWADVFLVSSSKLSSNAMWSFHNWIRNSVKSNKPWDRMAREIVTASGNTLENGAANYYVIHKEPTDLSENFSMAFLGMSITCARCHNHPMEKWTQKQYYQMANLFGRVGMKNGSRFGDVEVYTKPYGEVNHPRLNRPLDPAPLDGASMALDSPRDRREYLAEWLTSSKNQYFTRALVNRVWKNFMGRGLVEAVDDLRATNPPSNEELMQALCDETARHNFDVKHLIRTIMNSAAYQRSSKANEFNRQDEKYYSRYIVRRLNAEAMLDAISQVTGAPTAFPNYPAGMRAMQLPDARINSYFLKAFGKPERATTCECERSSEPTVTQALHIINGDTINQKLRAPGGVVDNFVRLGFSDEAIINHIYLSALSRRPSPGEMKNLQAVLKESAGGKDSRRHAIEDAAWSVLTSREFLFNH
jgi:uncharacterized protein DUF1549/uncharacterized protein DUF1553/Big-like domain-containing protein